MLPSSSTPSSPEKPPEKRGEVLPLSIQQRAYTKMPRYRSHWAVVGLQATGRADAEALQQATQLVVARHDALHMRLSREPGFIGQRLTSPAPISLISSEAKLADVFSGFASTSFDPEEHGFFRAQVAQCGKDVAVMLKIHHLAGDVVSYQILARELNETYEALLSGHVVEQPNSPSYAAYAIRHRDFTWPPTSRPEPDAIPSLAIPRPREGVPETGDILLDMSEAADRFRNRCGRMGVSTTAGFAAAVSLTIAAFHDAGSVPLMVAYAGRETPAQMKAVGLFGYPIVLQLPRPELMSSSELLVSVSNNWKVQLRRGLRGLASRTDGLASSRLRALLGCRLLLNLPVVKSASWTFDEKQQLRPLEAGPAQLSAALSRTRSITFMIEADGEGVTRLRCGFDHAAFDGHAVEEVGRGLVQAVSVLATRSDRLPSHL